MVRMMLRGTLVRWRRLLLSGAAVALGVMFVSGALAFNATLADGSAPGVPQQPDLTVTAPGGVPGDLVDRVRAVPGVHAADGVVAADGARLIGAGGKVVPAEGRSRLGIGWGERPGDTPLTRGRAPRADDEIAISDWLARRAGVGVGDRAGVLTLQPRRTFTVVGTFAYARDETQVVAFTEPVAQELMVGARGSYSAIEVTGAVALRHDIALAVGTPYAVQRPGTARPTGLAGDLLVGFAGVAVTVGAFLIFNTFAVLVAQRARELALLRALGAGRRQVFASVLSESALVGLAGSAAGVGGGIGVAALLLGGAVTVTAATVTAGLTVGILVSVAAAVVPAVRATRVSPLAVFRETAAPQRPLTRWTVAGVVLLAGGAGLGAPGVPALVLAAIPVALAGIALVTPALARPAAAVAAAVFARSGAARLGARNAGRNPRRTAVTATALMLGVALLAGISTVFVSATGSVGRLVADRMRADLVVSGDANGVSRTGFDPAVLSGAAALPGVLSVTGLGEGGAVIDGRPAYVETVTDLPALRDTLSLVPAAGRLDTLAADEILLDQRNVTAAGPHVGDRVTVQLPRGGPREFTVSGIYTDTDLLNGWLLPASAAPGFRQALPTQAYVRLAPGADLPAVRAALEALLRDSPEVAISDRAQYTAQQNAKANRLLEIVQLLLALAVLIAVLGIVNTVALSVLERTRELGLLRALGLRRGQTMTMTAVEATVISVFGALLGVLTGTALGALTVTALHGQGVTELTVPLDRLSAYVGLAVTAGVLASLPPAARAARLNVLRAIAFE